MYDDGLILPFFTWCQKLASALAYRQAFVFCSWMCEVAKLFGNMSFIAAHYHMQWCDRGKDRELLETRSEARKFISVLSVCSIALHIGITLYVRSQSVHCSLLWPAWLGDEFR